MKTVEEIGFEPGKVIVSADVGGFTALQKLCDILGLELEITAEAPPHQMYVMTR